MDGMKGLAKLLIAQLDLTIQKAAIVSFSGSARLDEALSADRNSLDAAIESLSAGGGTNIVAGLERAAEALEASTMPQGAKEVVWVLSDGKQSSICEPLQMSTQHRRGGHASTPVLQAHIASLQRCLCVHRRWRQDGHHHGCTAQGIRDHNLRHWPRLQRLY